MPNTILLLGAGFSKNWNGPLATEVTAHLISLLQGDAYLCDLLHRTNFEDALSQLQTEFLLLGKSKYPLQEARLTAFEAALSSVFEGDERGELLAQGESQEGDGNKCPVPAPEAVIRLTPAG